MIDANIKMWADMLIGESKKKDDVILNEDGTITISKEDFISNFGKLFVKLYDSYFLAEPSYRDCHDYFDKLVKPFLDENGYKCWDFDSLYQEMVHDWKNFERFITYAKKPSTQDSTEYYICKGDMASLYENGEWFMLPHDILKEIFEYDSSLVQKFSDWLVENRLVEYFCEFYDPDLNDLPGDVLN